MTLALDEFGLAMYKRLKQESDLLLKLAAQVRCARGVVEAHTELWLYLEAHGLDDDADHVYRQKLAHERILASLEHQETQQREKVRDRCLAG